MGTVTRRRDDATDVLIVGAGTAGIPCAIEAAASGARVVVVDKADRVGGTLHISGGHLAGAGTRRQAARDITDHPDLHFDDVMRIGRGRADPAILRRAVDLGAPTIDWLDDLGLEQAESSPRIVYGHEPYSIPRTHYGNDEARSILEVLAPRFDAAVEAGSIDLRLSTTARSLVVDDGVVVGAEVAGPGRSSEHLLAAATVLATGGYGANPDLFAELDGRPLTTVAAETSTGDGLALGRAVGAQLTGEGQFLPTFGGLPSPETGRALWTERAHLVAAERPPWEIYVDRHGLRFVAEDEPSIDAKERRLFDAVPDLVFHLVLDARGLRSGGPLIVGGRPLEESVNVRDGFVAARSLDELAVAAGIDPGGLRATVAEYNRALRAGEPDEFGRSFRPAPLVEPPFYAVRNHGTTVITFVGLKVNDQLEVLDEAGEVIVGLYAAGEVLGCAATMGNAFCGGMTLTPALAFGRDLGRRLGSRCS